MEQDTSAPVETTEANEVASAPSEDTPVDTREAAIAAAKAAMTKPAAEDKPEEVAEKPEAAKPETEEAKLKIFMRAKQQAQRERERGLEEAAKMRAQAQAEIEEARRIKAEYQRSQEILTKLRTKPNEAIKELGLHGEEFWQASLQEGQPDPVRDVKQTVESLKAELEAQKQAYAQWQEAQKAEQQRAQSIQIQNQFLGHIANGKDVYPTLNALYGEDGTDELIADAYKVAEDFHKRTGNYPPQEDIAEYLEYKHAQRYKRLTAREIAADEATRPTQSKRANGSRTLSNAVSAERASGVKPISELSDEDKIALARQAAEKAMREWKGSAA